MKINFKSAFNSSYIKLTLSYVAIVMVISIIFSISLYRISSSELGRGLGKQNQALRDIPWNQINSFGVLNLDQLRQDQLKESNQKLTNNLIYFNLLILLLSSIASYFLARLTLRPIEEAMDAQNRFTADASHELRTPLTAMKSEIEVSLRDSKLNLESAKDLLKSNLEEIEKLETLSKALLKLARQEGNQNQVFEEIRISEIIAEAYEKVEKIAIKKSITISCNPKLDSSIFSTIKTTGDKQSLVELFVILLDNAIKYSPQKSTISIKINQTKTKIYISIKDQGIGIKSSDLPYIFNRFYRADHSRSKEKSPGYGLGLSIAQRIIEVHKGKIVVSSSPDKGSKFTVKLGSS